MPGTRDLSDSSNKNSEPNPFSVANGMAISRLSAENIAEVKRIEIECRLSAWSMDDYLGEIERADAIDLVVEKDREIIGFIIARLITLETDYSLDNSLDNSPETNDTNNTKDTMDRKNSARIREAEIYNIAVTRAFQKQGVGQALLDRFLKAARDKSALCVWLEVRESNERARKFYKRNNFVEVYRRRNFYAAPVEDGIVMKLDLETEKPPKTTGND
jgi:ribosomal protein S18 acetylase RimI-like enzyme